MSTRGEHLVRADRRFATGGGVLARLAAPAFSRVLDQIDRRLASGGLDVTVPGGARRRLGFRATGASAAVRLHSWMALVRLATSGSPAPRARSGWPMRSPIAAATMRRAGRGRTSPPITTSATISTRHGSTRR
jgi:cyclopropane-fatty-acyl-phospholipid synthase